MKLYNDVEFEIELDGEKVKFVAIETDLLTLVHTREDDRVLGLHKSYKSVLENIKSIEGLKDENDNEISVEDFKKIKPPLSLVSKILEAYFKAGEGNEEKKQ